MIHINHLKAFLNLHIYTYGIGSDVMEKVTMIHISSKALFGPLHVFLCRELAQ